MCLINELKLDTGNHTTVFMFVTLASGRNALEGGVMCSVKRVATHFVRKINTRSTAPPSPHTNSYTAIDARN